MSFRKWITACSGIILAVALTRAAAAPDSFWQKVTWATADGVKLVGLYHPASSPGAQTWILLHGLGSVKEEWEGFARAAAQAGHGFFIYDARGHGESVRTVGEGTLDYRSWQSGGAGSPWEAMASDLGAAVGRLNSQFGVSSRQVAVGGASLGANVALTYAGRNPSLRAAILLSPGMVYAGIPAAPAYQTFRGRPILLAASAEDAYSYSTVRQLANLAADAQRTILEGRRGHGVQMLDGEMTRKIMDWMKRTTWK